MAHFVKIENNLVTNGIVLNNDVCGGGEFPESEPIGQAFIASLNYDGLWLQTSYHANFRGCYAGIGFTFDPSLGEYGEFVLPYSEPIKPLEKP